MKDTLFDPAPVKTAGLTACPACGGTLSEPIYTTGQIPVHSCLMLSDAASAAAFPTHRLSLSACGGCGFVTNTVFDTKWSAYDPEYEDQQSFSPTFNSFADSLALQTIDRYDLLGKRMVEVGCSKGDFMRLMAERGGLECVGIDPSVLPGRVPQPRRGSMRFHQAYYGPEHLDLPADFLCCRHTLEHIQDVAGTLRLMAEHMRRTPGAVLQIEVPDATRLWHGAAFEDIYYEHCSYFTPGSLARAMRAAGMALTDLRREYGDQYIVAEATLDPSDDRSFAIEEPAENTLQAIADLNGRIAAKVTSWRALVDSVAQPVIVWGSGSKCVAFLRATGLADRLSAIVDINPHRRGRFAPGLPRAISLPEDLPQDQPVTVIAMNPIYREEIAARCAELGLTATLHALD